MRPDRAREEQRLEERLALEREARRLLPSFHPRPGSLRRTLKSIVLSGESDLGPVLCKQLVHQDELWRWYFARELELLRSFAEEPPPVRCARLLGSDPEARLLLLEELPGPPLAGLRRLEDPVEAEVLTAAVELCVRLGGWDRGLGLSPRAPPPPRSRRAIRSRLLEDPSDPIGWVKDGITRGAQLGLCDEGLASAMIGALDRHPRVVFAHGDLLPRNLLRVAAGLAPVDWECAGSHLEGWDRALLWANLPAARPRLEASVGQDLGSRQAFWACTGFALVRELKFRRARPDDTRASTLREELERVRAELIRG